MSDVNEDSTILLKEEKDLLVAEEQNDSTSENESFVSVSVSEGEHEFVKKFIRTPMKSPSIDLASISRPHVRLTLVNEREDGSLDIETHEIENDKEMTLIIESDGCPAESDEEESSDEDEEKVLDESLSEALNNIKVLTSLTQEKKKKCHSRELRRKMGIIVNQGSDSEEDDFLARLPHMQIREIPGMTLTIPVDYESDDGNLTDVEQIQE
jgi:hypothetical protein